MQSRGVMSQVKLAAAKELIQEKRYFEARAVLKTVNDPMATKWLQQLDRIAPEVGFASQVYPAPPVAAPPNYPPPSMMSSPAISPEADRYYKRENKRANRRRIGSGIEIVLIGLFCLAIFWFSAQPVPSIEQGGRMVVNIGMGWMFVPLGLFCIIAGLVRLKKRD